VPSRARASGRIDTGLGARVSTHTRGDPLRSAMFRLMFMRRRSMPATIEDGGAGRRRRGRAEYEKPQGGARRGSSPRSSHNAADKAAMIAPSNSTRNGPGGADAHEEAGGMACRSGPLAHKMRGGGGFRASSIGPATSARANVASAPTIHEQDVPRCAKRDERPISDLYHCDPQHRRSEMLSERSARRMGEGKRPRAK
jgi:hypothetical protein